MVYTEYEKAIYNDVNSLFNNYNSKNNIFNKHKHERPIKFDIRNSMKKDAKQPEINAYAYYRDNEDEIIITTELFRLMHKLFTTIETPDKAAFMLTVASLFCVAHEFAHLYTGHCQLSDTRMLNAMYDSDSGFSSLDYHTIEYDADCTAASKVAEKIMQFTRCKSIIEIYGSKESIIDDCLKAIHGFFFILRYVDGSANKLYYSDTHPPSIARLIYSTDALCIHAKEMYRETFSTKQIKEMFVENEALFSNGLGLKMVNNDYILLFDNSLIEYKIQLEFNWKENIKKRLKDLTRMPLAFE